MSCENCACKKKAKAEAFEEIVTMIVDYEMDRTELAEHFENKARMFRMAAAQHELVQARKEADNTEK